MNWAADEQNQQDNIDLGRRVRFEIFRIESDGSRNLCGTAPSFPFAELAIFRLARSNPGMYVIVDPHGRETIMNLDKPGGRDKTMFQLANSFNIGTADREKLSASSAREAGLTPTVVSNVN